jgi:hypothetical protein
VVKTLLAASRALTEKLNEVPAVNVVVVEVTEK